MSSSICTRCKTEKPLFDFSDHPASSNGKQSQCKDCFAERARIKRIGKPCMTCGKPKEVGVPRGARLCLSCASVCYVCKVNERAKQHRMCKQCMAKWEKSRRSTADDKHKERVARIASKYRVKKSFAATLAVLKHCDACGKECTRVGELHVDHCHETESVRGVLCFNCNAALGHLGDSVDRLQMLIRYMENYANAKRHLTDYEKAAHYLQKLIEIQESK